MRRILVYSTLVLAANLAAYAQTYSKEVSRIFRDRCETCHREGDIAPFALKDYETAVAWSLDIRRVLNRGTMPPWKPVAGHGEFKDNRSITDEDKKTILDWIDQGTPEGDPADLPPPMESQADWQLGYPDKVMTMLETYTPKIGKDDYRCFVLPTDFGEDKYLAAMDFRPGDRQLVHHIILYLDTEGESVKLDEKDPEPGYECFGGPGTTFNVSSLTSLLSAGRTMVGGWAPGQRAQQLPEGVGVEIPKGARIIMQVHYFPVAGTGPDQTSVGFYFTKEKPQRRLYHIPLVNTSFKIPPGAAEHQVTATLPAFLDVNVISIYPHMHLLGKDIKVEYTKAGKKIPMIYIDKWDFNWQGYYNYVEPIKVNAALLDNMRLTCTFDNSENNPRNPNNPLVPVGWGEGTQDEMCLAFLAVTIDMEPQVFPFSRNAASPVVK